METENNHPDQKIERKIPADAVVTRPPEQRDVKTVDSPFAQVGETLKRNRKTFATARERERKREKRESLKRFKQIEEEQVQLYKEQVGLETDPKFVGEMEEIANRLAQAAGFKEKIKVLPIVSDEINAYVYTIENKTHDTNETGPGLYNPDKQKGRYVFLYTGLVKSFAEFQAKSGRKLSKDNIAFVVAHEMRHLLQQRKEQTNAVTKRQQEYDADLGGMEIMGRAGFNPREAVEGMEFLRSLSEGRIPYSETHPASASRLVEVSKRIADPDVPMRGIGVKPADYQHMPSSEPKSKQVISELQSAANIQELVAKLSDRTDSAIEATTTALLAAEAVRYSATRQMAEDPRLRGLSLKYLYVMGKELAGETEKELAEIAEIKKRVEELERLKAERALTDEEFSDLRNKRKELKDRGGKAENFEGDALNRSKGIFTSPEDDKWGQAWKSIPAVRTSAIENMPPLESYVEDTYKETYVDAEGFMKSFRMKVDKDLDWQKLNQEWEAGEISDPEVRRFVELGLKVKQAAKPESSVYDLQTSEGRSEYTRDFTVFFLDRYSKSYNSSNKKIQEWMAAAVKDQSTPLTDKIRAIVDERCPEGLDEQTKRRVIQFFMANLVPHAGTERPYFSSVFGSPESYKAEVGAILTMLPDLAYTPEKALDSNLASFNRHGYHAQSFGYFYSLGSGANRTQEPQLVEDAITRMSCRFPGESNSIEALKNLSQNAPPIKVNELLQFYQSKIKEGASEEDLAALRRAVGDQEINGQRLTIFLLRAYGLRDFEVVDEKKEKALNKNELQDFVQKLTADGYGNFVMEHILTYVYQYYISPSDIESRVYLESFLQQATSNDLNAIHDKSLFHNLPEFSSAASLKMEEILELLPSLNSVVPKEHLGSLIRDGQISFSQLRAYYEKCAAQKESGTEHKWNDKTLTDKYLEAVFYMILERATAEIDPEKFKDLTKNPIGTMEWDHNTRYWGYDVLEKTNLSLEKIAELFPACDFRNKLLLNWWRKNNFDPAQFEVIFPLFAEDDDGWGRGRNSLSLPELIAMGASEQEGEISEAGQMRYELLKKGGKLEDYSHFMLLSDSGRLGALESKYQQDPQFFISPQRSLTENLEFITKLLPANDFRDYLINKSVKAELWQIVGEQPDTSIIGIDQYIEDPELRHMLTQGGTAAFVDKLDFPPKEIMDRLGGIGVLERVRAVFPHINSDATRVALGRLALQYGDPKSKEEELDLIKEFFTKPSFARDYILKEYMLKHSLALEEIKGLKTLLTSDIVREGEVGQGEFLGMEFFRSEVYRFKPERRAEYLLWLIGIQDEPPKEMQIPGGLFALSFDSVRTNFSQLTPTEKRELLGDFLLYKEGLFQPGTPETEKVMRDFIETMFDNRLATGTENDGLLKKILVTVFEKSLPERRHALFTSLFFALEQNKGAKMEFEDLLPLLLEHAGIFGTKVAQILSERENAPFSKTNEKMPDSLKKKLGKAKEKAEPFNTIGVVYNLEDNKRDTEVKSIDALLSTASLKQAHKSTTANGQQIEKVKKPNVEKYIDHDIEVLKSVCDLLRQEGYRVPKYFVEYITSIVKDEADFMNEAENQRLLSGHLTQQREGYKLGVPTINFASSDLMEETIAPGISLDRVKETDPGLYRKHSRLTGLELLKGLFEEGVFHADLHDGNEFIDEDSKIKTYIDAGAVGDVRGDLKSVRRLFKGILLRNPRTLAESIVDLSETDPVNRNQDIQSLSDRLSGILQERLALGEKVSRISFEIIDTAVPKRSLRYVLKALVTGSHHVEQVSSALSGTEKPKLTDRLKVVKDLGTIGMHILTA